MAEEIFYETDYVALDLETTGLSPAADKIIEIGALRVVDGEIKETFSTYVNPHRRLDPRISQLTGITQAQVDEAPDIEDIIDSLVEFIGDRPLLGHNIIFDYSFIKKAVVNSGVKKYDKLGIDTLKICRVLLTELESKRLENVSDYFGIELIAHRAYEDARASHEIYQKLIDRYTHETIFKARPLVYTVKKDTPATQKQIAWVKALLSKHNIIIDREPEALTKSEASRLIDKILSEFGR